MGTYVCDLMKMLRGNDKSSFDLVSRAVAGEPKSRLIEDLSSHVRSQHLQESDK